MHIQKFQGVMILNQKVFVLFFYLFCSDLEKAKSRDDKIMSVYKRYKEADIAVFGIPMKTTSV